MSKDITELRVEGMDCANCAMSITRYLERKGLKDVYVNFQTKEVRFSQKPDDLSLDKIKQGIHKLGYSVVEEDDQPTWWDLRKKLFFSAVFTFPLLLHHILMVFGSGLPGFDNAYVQLGVCLPVFVIGLLHFGSSALSSIRGGVPNMDVLIFVGSTAAFGYSLIGTLLLEADYIFYETAATIITLVLVGNLLEQQAVERTTSAIGELSQLQASKARRILPGGRIEEIEQQDIGVGDLLQINEGDIIPADARVEQGQAQVDESMLTGESRAVAKHPADRVIGASVVQSGNLQVRVTAIGRDSVLGQMIELVKTAQQDKPALQRLADRISAVFVPVVLGIAALTFLIGWQVVDLPAFQASMNAIAVLVISCPCAMGLATPTAVMVGVGRLAKQGVLIKGGRTIETLAQIERVVFDKTGTLTSGDFALQHIDYAAFASKTEVNAIIYKMEQHSSHPIAQSLQRALQHRLNGTPAPELQVEELKGVGMQAYDQDGHHYQLGSARLLEHLSEEQELPGNLFLLRDKTLLAALSIGDTLKSGAADSIDWLVQKGLQPIILSGDREDRTAAIARELGIEEYYAEQLPQEKLQRIEQLSQKQPTAMVGDGINDAPALARATLGISLSDASQVAVQSAQVVLLNGQIERIPSAVATAKATLLTIRQNLFWAFAYNIIAIPIAAVGLLNPMWGALFMAFSDVVVIGNSVRLRHRKIKV